MSAKTPGILITGAAGFIASTLITRLLKESSYSIIGIDNFHEFYPRFLKEENLKPLRENPRFSFHEGDFADTAIWKKITDSFQIQTVVHFAAFAGVRPSLVNPLGYYENNVTKTIQLLELLRTHEIQNLLFTSSSSVYGGVKALPFSETQKVDSPVSPYAATKKAGEEIISNYCHLYALKAMSFRLFTVFGPKQRPDLAIRKFMVSVEKGQIITLFGDGSSQRDYTFVDDIVQGYVLALEKIPSYTPGTHEVFNLGAGRAIRLLEMLSVIEETLGKKAKVEYAPRHPADLEATLADISKAKSMLGYAPQVSFQEGVARLSRWLLENPKAREQFQSVFP